MELRISSQLSPSSSPASVSSTSITSGFSYFTSENAASALSWHWQHKYNQYSGLMRITSSELEPAVLESVSTMFSPTIFAPQSLLDTDYI